jgi:hypothetical protein
MGQEPRNLFYRKNGNKVACTDQRSERGGVKSSRNCLRGMIRRKE